MCRRKIVWFVVLSGLVVFCSLASAERTIIDNERGGFFTYPLDQKWDQVGICVGLDEPNRYPYEKMTAEAIKGIHARLQHFEQVEKLNYSRFPFQEFTDFEADEIARGREPLWVTTTYKGEKKKVLFSWHARHEWGDSQAVNIRDDRFIHFLIHNYVYKTLDKQMLPGWWVGLDNCAFVYGLYGIWDEKHEWIDKPTWDKPFPQNDQEWLDAAKYCFRRIKDLAPDIRFICNEGTSSDMSQYADIFGITDGIIMEGFLNSDKDRDKNWGMLSRLSGVNKNRVQVFQCSRGMDDPNRLLDMYIAYSIFRGYDSFFNAKDGNSVEIAPTLYQEVKNALGSPVGITHNEHEEGMSEGYQLHWRECEGGIAYYNRTGKSKTITLPAGRSCYSPDGQKVESITLDDLRGTYVTYATGSRAAKPTINPRRAQTVTGPLSVTLETATAGGVIRYTTNGAEPDANCPEYTGPITLDKSTSVKAKTFASGKLDSFAGSATYTITNVAPTVEFYMSADRGSEFLSPHYPLVMLSNPSGKTVTVRYAVAGGTAQAGSDFVLADGTVTFMPGEIYRRFPVEIKNDSSAEADEYIVIKLSEPTNAQIGKKYLYFYTIVDNDD